MRRLEEAARAVGELAREVRSGKRALLTVGCVTSGLFDALPPLVRAFTAVRPDVVVSVREMDTTVALEALRSGEVDVALARLDRALFPIGVVPGAADWLVVALPEGDALAEGESVDLSVLDGRPFIVIPQGDQPGVFRPVCGGVRGGGVCAAGGAGGDERAGATGACGVRAGRGAGIRGHGPAGATWGGVPRPGFACSDGWRGSGMEQGAGKPNSSRDGCGGA